MSELYYGAYKSQRINENIAAIEKLEDTLEIIDSNEKICKNFGKLKAELEKEGKIIDDADLFIAVCALTNNLILITKNEKHFGRIESLKLENWKEIWTDIKQPASINREVVHVLHERSLLTSWTRYPFIFRSVLVTRYLLWSSVLFLGIHSTVNHQPETKNRSSAINQQPSTNN